MLSDFSRSHQIEGLKRGASDHVSQSRLVGGLGVQVANRCLLINASGEPDEAATCRNTGPGASDHTSRLLLQQDPRMLDPQDDMRACEVLPSNPTPPPTYPCSHFAGPVHDSTGRGCADHRTEASAGASLWETAQRVERRAERRRCVGLAAKKARS